MEVMNFCSPELKVPHPFVICRQGMTRITINGLQSLLNFMGVGALLPETFGDAFLFDFVHIVIIHLQKAIQRPMPAKTSRLSSMT
jgi:hypothetical protein